MMINLYDKISKYLSITYVNLKNSTVYKSEFVFICIRNIIVILIYIQFYSMTYKSSGTTKFDDLSLQQILWLLVLTRTIAIDWSTTTLISNEIRSGDLAYSAARPYSYILSHYASLFGRRLPQFFFGDLFSNLLPALFLIGTIPINLITLFASGFLILLGITIEFCAQTIIGLLAFWLNDVTAIRWIYQKMYVIFGGIIIPIALFPEKLQMISNFLPFTSVYYNPVKVMVNFRSDLFFKTLSLQIFWLIFFITIAEIIFRKGLKNVSIQGS